MHHTTHGTRILRNILRVAGFSVVTLGIFFSVFSGTGYAATNTATFGSSTATGTSITLNVTISGNATEPVELLYKTQADTTKTSMSGSATNGVATFNIPNLLQCTTYYFQLSGESFAPVNYTFATMALPNVFSVAGLSSTDESITIKGKVTGNPTEPIEIRYKKQSDTGYDSMGGTVSGGAVTSVLNGLDPDTTYYFRISGNSFCPVNANFKTTNNGTTSTGTTSGGTTGTTSSGTTSGGTTGTTTGTPDATVVVTPKERSANFKISMTGTYGSTILFISYGPDQQSPVGKVTAMHNSTDFSGMISGLSPDTTYYFDLLSADGITPISSQVQSFKTEEGAVPVAGVVTNLAVANIGYTRATITGRVLSTKEAIAVMVDKDGDGEFEFSRKPVVATDKTFTLPLVGLEADHGYAVVVANANDPKIRYTRESGFKTLAVSAVPYASQIGGKTATITATISEGAKSPSVRYAKEPDKLSDPVAMIKDSEGTYSTKLSGLTGNTTYGYQIVGMRGTEIVPYTGVFSFTTDRDSTGGTVPIIQGVGGLLDGITGGGNTSGDGFAGGLVNCGKDGPLDSNDKQDCGFEDFMALVSAIIDILLFIVAPAIAVCVILYAGILMLTSAGNTENATKAKGLILKAVVGLVLAMCAWLIVKFVMVTLGYNEALFPKFY